MKTKQLLLKTLLLAAGLCVGASAWAAEVTETYDFGAFITANGAANLTTSGDAIAQSGTSTKVGSVKVIDNLTANSKTLELNGRFAVDYQYNAGVQIRFMWRSSGTAYQHGLAGNWNGKGSADAQGAARFSVLNLKAGDKITFTYSMQSGKDANPYTCSASQLTGKAADQALSSGTEYTVAATGNLDLYFTNNNFAISKIVIVTTGTETIEADPEINVTGANLGNRTITIVDSKTNSGNATKTYYTKDGSTPTNLSTLYDGPFTVTSADVVEGNVTIKAITYKEDDTSVASEVTTKVLTDVGTTLTLNAPAITFAGYVLEDGYYRPKYDFSSNQASVTGNPSPTISYSFAGGDATEATSYTSTAAGSLTVTVSKDGYNSNSTVLDIVGGNFSKTYSFDAIDDVELAEPVDWASGGTAYSVNGAGWSFATLSYTTYTLRADITLTNIVYARATTANKKQGFFARASGASIGYTLADGEYIVFNTSGNPILATSESSSTAIAQYTNVRKIEVFTPLPATVSKTITAAGYATFCSPYALNFTGSGLKAYIAETSGSAIAFNEVTSVPAETGVLLKGDAKDYNINVIAVSSTDVSGNKFVGILEDTEIPYASESDAIYVLKNGTSGVGFYKTKKAFTVGANTAYLPASVAAAREFIGFEDETTGIESVQGEGLKVSGSENYYNLNGQRVVAPTKGLYIVNGKKVIVK